MPASHAPFRRCSMACKWSSSEKKRSAAGHHIRATCEAYLRTWIPRKLEETEGNGPLATSEGRPMTEVEYVSPSAANVLNRDEDTVEALRLGSDYARRRQESMPILFTISSRLWFKGQHLCYDLTRTALYTEVGMLLGGSRRANPAELVDCITSVWRCDGNCTVDLAKTLMTSQLRSRKLLQRWKEPEKKGVLLGSLISLKLYQRCW